MSALAALLLVAGCQVSVDYTGTAYQCGPHGECPGGYSCVEDRCVADAPQGTTCAAAVAAGASHTCALRTDGTVWCWGANESGELGDGTTTDRGSPTEISGLTGVIAIAAGNLHACALLGAGTVECWGWNVYGQVGDGTTTSRLSPTPVPGLSGVVAISAA